jgi:molybdenum cofactor biosynthesis enzyme MoaA
MAPAELKAPFSATEAELWELGAPDVHLSGFGPWFSGAVLVTALGLGLCLGIVTNGTLLGQREAEDLAEAGMRTVSISIDGTCRCRAQIARTSSRRSIRWR